MVKCNKIFQALLMESHSQIQCPLYVHGLKLVNCFVQIYIFTDFCLLDLFLKGQ